MTLTNSEDHLNWTVDQILKALENRENLGFVSRDLKYLSKNLCDRTSFLDENYPASVTTTKTRLNMLKLGIRSMDDVPMCAHCGKHPVRILKKEKEFSTTCSTKCERLEAAKKTRKTWGSDGCPLSRPDIHMKGVEKSKSLESREKMKKTVMDRYGVENIMHHEESKNRMVESLNTSISKRGDEILEKRRSTCIERYGAESHMHVPEIAKKVQESHLKRTGYRSPLQNPQSILKYMQTCMDRYGVENPYTDREIRDKARQTHFERYGVTHPNQREDLTKYLDDKDFVHELYYEYGISGACDILGCSNATFYRAMKKHGIDRDQKNKSSYAEIQICEMIRGWGFDAQQTVNDVISNELDILVPSKNLAIEYNGLYWHSSKFKDKGYHLSKTRECEKQGIRLIHIMEDEWNNRREQVINMLKNILGVATQERVFARKTDVISKTSVDVSEFLEANHIQGSTNGSIIYGLEYNGEMVATMVFTKYDDGFLLSRYATSCSVIGGFSKLLKYFINKHSPKRIVSFADKRYSVGGVYLKNGFNHVYDTPPDYKYILNGRRFHKKNFRHGNWLKDLPNYDSNLSERMNTESHGIYRVYDCGLMKFVWTP